MSSNNEGMVTWNDLLEEYISNEIIEATEELDKEVDTLRGYMADAEENISSVGELVDELASEVRELKDTSYIYDAVEESVSDYMRDSLDITDDIESEVRAVMEYPDTIEVINRGIARYLSNNTDMFSMATDVFFESEAGMELLNAKVQEAMFDPAFMAMLMTTITSHLEVSAEQQTVNYTDTDLHALKARLEQTVERIDYMIST